MTTQEQAEQLARKFGNEIGKILARYAGSDIDLLTAGSLLQEQIDDLPLFELLEVARAANELERTYTSDGVDVYETNKLCKALQSLRETGFEI